MAEDVSPYWNYRALSVRPEFIVCHEPVSALDVLPIPGADLKSDDGSSRTVWGLRICLLTHNLSVIKHISDNVQLCT